MEEEQSLNDCIDVSHRVNKLIFCVFVCLCMFLYVFVCVSVCVLGVFVRVCMYVCIFVVCVCACCVCALRTCVSVLTILAWNASQSRLVVSDDQVGLYSCRQN